MQRAFTMILLRGLSEMDVSWQAKPGDHEKNKVARFEGKRREDLNTSHSEGDNSVIPEQNFTPEQMDLF
jgi:hypothetical protein